MKAAEWISPETRFWRLPESFGLEGGGRLAEVTVAYRTWGRLDAGGGNGVLVCHALTGSADADDWWGGLFGTGRALDPERDFIVCSNVLGSCYGTTGPTGARPGGERPWGGDFPPVTVRDLVRLQQRLLDHLGVRRLRLVVGGSLGGMQVLEWAAMDPERVAAIAPIGCSSRHSAWCIGWSEAQRRAITGDPLWAGGHYPPEAPPRHGLAVARMIAMATYRSQPSFERRFGRQVRTGGDGGELFEVASYLGYQGEKLHRRFDAASYVTLTRAMDSHDLGRGRGGVAAALEQITCPALVVSLTSDVLYPPAEQEALARGLPRGELCRIVSDEGHDGFLIETEALDRALLAFRRATAEAGEEDGGAAGLRACAG